ncbi:MAG: hypothetical protein HY868_25375 [Chloroflexi bacterium]|nr:hypothetical protein [Chloroflexota bacterium]
MVTLNEIRVALIWTETYPTLLTPAGATAPMAFLGQKTKYAAEFEKAIEGASAWEPPWPLQKGKGRHHFWYHYFGNVEPANVKGNLAWDYLAPFHTNIAKIRADWLNGRASAEGFFFAHGIAFLVTVSLTQEDATLDLAVDTAQDARATGIYNVTWRDGSAMSAPLDVIAAHALDRLREMALGAGAVQGTRPGKPFTLVTIIKGDGGDASIANSPNGAVHRALEGLCSWHATWQTDALHNLDEAKLKTRYTADGHLLYGLARGRALWFPGLFGLAKKRTHKLSCYHRNLALLSLQTEMVMGLMRHAAAIIEANQVMPVAMDQLAKKGAGLAGRLYGKTDAAYQSWSARRQMTDADALDAIDQVRLYFGDPMLKRA